jgi:peroxiredoxin
LGRIYKEFQTANTEVLVILGDTIERAKQYAQTLKTPFPVLADPDREVYQAFELNKVAFVIQRTASVVVDREGLIQYIKRTVNPMTWLQESRELLEYVKGMESKS